MFNSALKGVQSNMQNMRNTAHDIANAGTSKRDAKIDEVAEDVVELKVQEQGVKVSLFSIKVADEVMGALLDKDK